MSEMKTAECGCVYFGSVQLCKTHAAAPDLLAALQLIAKGEGAFASDPLTHAGNCIDSMKNTAQAAIAKATNTHSPAA